MPEAAPAAADARPGCPSDATFAQLVEGTLGPEGRANLEAHLERCSACDRAMAELGPLLAHAAATTPGMPERAPGGGRYTISAALGRGGFGSVYDAEDGLLHRRVALKFLHASAAREEARQRMLEEARALAALSHPNVVQIYDVDVDGPAVFLAMERLEGETLREWLRRPGRRSLRNRWGVVCGIAEGLAAAHRASILHRDVKPENVIVGRDNRVWLTDFGLATYADAGPSRLGGTPAYFAPELLVGAPPSALSDQYAFALLARECLFGVPPRSQEASPPPDADAPASLWAVLRRALAHTPQSRFASLEELRRALLDAILWDESPHATGAAVVQSIMSAVYTCVSAFSLWALLSEDTPEPDAIFRAFGVGAWAARIQPGDAHGAALWAAVDPGAWAFDLVGAFLVVLLMSGWMPIAAIWGLVNAWGLRTRRRWARTSTLAYGVLSLLTLVGTPAGAYLVYATARANRAPTP